MLSFSGRILIFVIPGHSYQTTCDSSMIFYIMDRPEFLKISAWILFYFDIPTLPTRSRYSPLFGNLLSFDTPRFFLAIILGRTGVVRRRKACIQSSCLHYLCSQINLFYLLSSCWLGSDIQDGRIFVFVAVYLRGRCCRWGFLLYLFKMGLTNKGPRGCGGLEHIRWLQGVIKVYEQVMGVVFNVIPVTGKR